MKRTVPLTRRGGLPPRGAPLRGVPLARVSRKRAAQLRAYSVLRADYLAEHLSCEWCGQPATDLHHRRGRVGADLCDPAHFAALCRICHHEATVRPAWALSVGLSEPRIGRAS